MKYILRRRGKKDKRSKVVNEILFFNFIMGSIYDNWVLESKGFFIC